MKHLDYEDNRFLLTLFVSSCLLLNAKHSLELFKGYQSN